ncbi:MAG: phasin family protein [Holosporaceae bacterium]|jgi:phasin family protein|nr:phasin family protein [Holosporaceae bacterium]
MATSTSANTSEKAKDDPFANFKIPTFDTSAILDSYKKNLEILGLINKMSLEVCNGIAKLQAAFVKQMIADTSGLLGSKPSDASAKLSEVTRDTIVRAVGNGKQINDMVTAASNDITAATARRFKESIEEAKNILNKK